MNFVSLLRVSILVTAVAVTAKAGARADGRPVASRSGQGRFRQGGGPGTFAQMVKKRSAANGWWEADDDEDDDVGWETTNGEKQEPRVLSVLEERGSSKEKVSESIQPARSHGEFNMDTSSCDVIAGSSCQKPSDCGGCLGLFTCRVPPGQCQFKGVSRRTGLFDQNVQRDPETR